jgi:K+-sensing histidine kinase KdpD
VDAALLRQVFVNLIGNAMKSAGATGKPDVYMHPGDGSEQIVVEVRETGRDSRPNAPAGSSNPSGACTGTSSRVPASA